MTSTVTREMVLAAANALRTTDPDGADEKTPDRLLRDIIGRTIDVGTDVVDYVAYPTSTGADVDGVLIDVSLYRLDTGASRSLATAALASADAAGPLQGIAKVSGLPLDAASGGRTLTTVTMSGDVVVTSPVDTTDVGVLELSVGALPSAGSAPSEPATPPASPTPRSPAELAAARSAYAAALKKAKKKYAKARKKAGTNKRKKAAAKEAYAKRKSRAKAAYRAAIADVPASPASPAAPPTSQPDTGTSSVIISTDVGWMLSA